MENETQNLINIPTSLLLSSLAHSYFLISYIPKGLLRVISLIPIFHIFSILPWYSSSSLLRGILSFFITWITSFKLLLFCFHKGPLIYSNYYIDFVMLSIFPINIKQNQPPLASYLSPKSASKIAGPILLILTDLYVHKEKYPKNTTFLAHSLCIICGLYFLSTRYELLQLFNKPYLAKSLKEFWGRRWNRLSSNILKEAIYNPCQNSFKGIIGFGAAKVAAITLVLSGIMHELMFYYITCGKKPSWEVTQFFVLQGISMAFEGALAKR